MTEKTDDLIDEARQAVLTMDYTLAYQGGLVGRLADALEAATHPDESKGSAPRAMLCRDCCMVRCDAYPGACRGENYYD